MSVSEPTRASTVAPLPSARALPPLDPTVTPWPGSYVDLDGVRLHVRRTPGPGADAPEAVYLHGLGGSATNWTDLAAQLSGHVEGHALDMPGFGRTEPPPSWAFTPAAQADVAIAYLESLGGAPVQLFGNSLGGLTAILVAARRPDLVATLTLISPAVPDRRPDPRRVSDPRLLLASVPVLGRAARRELQAMSPRERTMAVLRLVFADPTTATEQRIAEAEQEAAERAGLPWAGRALTLTGLGMFRLWMALGSGSVWSALRKVTAPTLVVWGTEDRLVAPRKAVPTVRALPRGRLLMLSRTGHVAQMEHPVTVAKAVLDMWESVANGSW